MGTGCGEGIGIGIATGAPSPKLGAGSRTVERRRGCSGSNKGGGVSGVIVCGAGCSVHSGRWS